MSTPNAFETMDYVLDMLAQLARLAKSNDLDGIAGRIETVIVVELADARCRVTKITTALDNSSTSDRDAM